ncbi:MAG: hypothetical protein EBS54_10265 [Betaproteobacteria bacterium]|nr:hypothetical protein [Betaproteobacteria bacterium]
MTKEEKIAYYKAKLAALEAPEKTDAFEAEIAKHKDTLQNIYKALKKATGKERGVDSAILTALAESMGMRGMTITKKVQQRKPK